MPEPRAPPAQVIDPRGLAPALGLDHSGAKGDEEEVVAEEEGAETDEEDGFG